MTMPATLCRSFMIEGVDEDGELLDLWSEDCNIRRLVIIPVNRRLKEIRIIPLSDYGGNEKVNIFSVEIL